MICPKCGSPTRVKDSVVNTTDNEVYRLVVCSKCKHKFYTVEFEAVCNKEFTNQWHKLHRSGARRKGE